MITDSTFTNAKLILIDFLIQINIYQYLTVTYQYLVKAYIVRANLTRPDQYLNDRYRLLIQRQTLLE